MLDWENFNLIFQPKPDFNPSSKQVDEVNRHRKELGGVLFFDRIWTSLGLKQHPAKVYPPRSNTDLRKLWSTIVQADIDDEKKLSLLYYLVRDHRISTADVGFAQNAYIPPKYQLLVAGLWELDHCQFSRALEHLTHSSLPPTFSDETLSVLLQHPKCDKSLALAYYIAVRPPLEDSAVLEAYFALLIQTNVTEAYHFAQQRSEHQQLLEKLAVTIHEEAPSEARASRALQLIGLPFTQEEVSWFEECLTKGPSARLPGAKESLVMRQVACARSIAKPGQTSAPAVHKADASSLQGLQSMLAG